MSIKPEAPKPPLTIKIILLGESSVGKTSLAARYTDNTFQHNQHLLTIGVDVKRINKPIMDRTVRLELWDTAGQEKYRTLPLQYFRGIQGVLLVYDISNGESFLKIQDWLQKVEQNCITNQLAITLVGNKNDLQELRQVKKETAADFAISHKMKFCETSAKTAAGVDKVIDEMMTQIVEKGGGFTVKKGTKLSTEGESVRQQKDSCC